jgi:hypothetical protein
MQQGKLKFVQKMDRLPREEKFRRSRLESRSCRPSRPPGCLDSHCNRRNLMISHCDGGSDQSSAFGSIFSSITLSDFDDDSFFQDWSGSRRGKLDECPEEEEKECCEEDTKTTNSRPLMKRDSIDSGKISVSARRLRDLPMWRSTGSERPPMMPFRKESLQSLVDCKPARPCRHESIPKLTTEC